MYESDLKSCRSKKHSRWIFPLLIFIGLLFIYSWLTNSGGVFEGPVKYLKSDKKVGVIEILGTIEDSTPVVTSLNELLKNNSLSALLVRVNSPGGSVGASQEIYEKLKIVQRSIPVYVSMLNVAASGGYYISLGANKIYANAGTITGSIGVIISRFEMNELLAKIGVKLLTDKAGRNKDILSPYRKSTPEEKLLIRGILESSHKQFKQAVLDNRENIDKSNIDELADGRIFTGEQAAENGLIDGIYSFDQVVEIIQSDLDVNNVELVYPPIDERKYLASILGLALKSAGIGVNRLFSTQLKYLFQ